MVASAPTEDYAPPVRKGATVPKCFDTFIHGENIKNFERRIATEADPVRLALLKTLLKDEKARVPEDPKVT